MHFPEYLLVRKDKNEREIGYHYLVKNVGKKIVFNTLVSLKNFGL